MSGIGSWRPLRVVKPEWGGDGTLRREYRLPEGDDGKAKRFSPNRCDQRSVYARKMGKACRAHVTSESEWAPRSRLASSQMPLRWDGGYPSSKKIVATVPVGA